MTIKKNIFKNELVWVSLKKIDINDYLFKRQCLLVLLYLILMHSNQLQVKRTKNRGRGFFAK